MASWAQYGDLSYLTVAKTGSGSGTVSSPDGSIDCGARCYSLLFPGIPVTLTASSAPGSVFYGWSGGGCSGFGTCTISGFSSVYVTATFGLANGTRVSGISTRMGVLTGDDVMIGGFVIAGQSPKRVVVRARGTSLGVAGALADPTLALVPSSGGPALFNDDWGTAANAADLAATGYAPENPKESALLVTLDPGAYTAIVSGVGNTTGVAIVEVYELDHPELPLIGISTRGRVQTGDGVMIGGFAIQGSTPQTVIVRARGLSLVSGGILDPLANPMLQLVWGQTVIATNDDWQTAPNAAQIGASGFAPADEFESAIMMTLAPGNYTAIVSGVNGTTGVSIVEVFTIP